MALFLFWIKIFINRFLNLFKSSLVLIIWIAVVAGAFIFVAVNNYISLSLDEGILFITLPFLVIYALIKSLKNYNLMPLLVRYSKSNFNNSIIYASFFLKQALFNNILLILFIIAAYYSLRKIKYLLLFFVIGVLSIIVSFLVMYFKNKYINEKIKKVRLNKNKINPLIKSALHEYITPNFIFLISELSFQFGLAVLSHKASLAISTPKRLFSKYHFRYYQKADMIHCVFLRAFH